MEGLLRQIMDLYCAGRKLWQVFEQEHDYNMVTLSPDDHFIKRRTLNDMKRDNTFAVSGKERMPSYYSMRVTWRRESSSQNRAVAARLWKRRCFGEAVSKCI